MKKLLVLLTVALIWTVGTAPLSYAQIAGTSHDFSGEGWSGGYDEICSACHTPHNADTSVTNAPLWDHVLTTAAYTVYTNPATLDATMDNPPDGVSKLCLSCHDGTVALDAFGGRTPTAGAITGDALLGTDLSDDHPVSFTYDTALATADTELIDPDQAASGPDGGTIADEMLFSDEMHCASCHDVHDGTNKPFLRIVNTASALCLTCHDK
ncbi:MAG: cytochrome c3 family protein [Desulfobacterales bacterium]|nr:cytochrome c3 family protein [Desulfobacterales bacterium]